jgi:transcriptional regulator
MFVRACWEPSSDEEMYALIEKHSWALLVNNGAVGPFATNIPLLLNRSRSSRPRLVGHLATANAHAAALLRATEPTLAIFEGPSSYVTASWYPRRDMPPTVYYTAVHCYGRILPQQTPELRAWLETLTEQSERDFANGWKSAEIPEPEITRRLPHIVGFELEIDRIEGKFKLGQDEPRRDAMAVAESLLQSDEPKQRTLGEMVRRYNESRPM